MKVKEKLLFFIFLIDLTDNSSFKILTETMYWLYICIYTLMYNYGWWSKWYEGQWRMICYYKGLALPVKLYSFIRQWTWISCKCMLQNQRQLLKKISITDMLRKEREWGTTHSLKTTKGWKSVEDEVRDRRWHTGNWEMHNIITKGIKDHLDFQWSKCAD